MKNGSFGGPSIRMPTAAADNITELLLKIIEFTQTRQKILIQNINQMHTGDFLPKDLPVDEFSNLMALALNEHSNSRRLVFCDGQNIKFGAGGSFDVTPIIDEQGKELIAKDRNEYLRVQINRLLENSLNQKIALELLKQKQVDERDLRRRLN
jgi:flagellar basal body rod protein FlgB